MTLKVTSRLPIAMSVLNGAKSIPNTCVLVGSSLLWLLQPLALSSLRIILWRAGTYCSCLSNLKRLVLHGFRQQQRARGSTYVARTGLKNCTTRESDPASQPARARRTMMVIMMIPDNDAFVQHHKTSGGADGWAVCFETLALARTEQVASCRASNFSGLVRPVRQ